MGFLPWLLGAILLGGVITAAKKSAQGAELQQKFVGLGNLVGKTKDEIIAAVGPPNSLSSMGDDSTLLQWQTQGYHIALLFRGELCEGVTHEHASDV